MKLITSLVIVFITSLYADSKSIKFASGPVDGEYHKYVDRLNEKGFKFKNIVSIGSGDNLKKLYEDKVDLAISQVDILKFINKKIDNSIKDVMPLYYEEIYLLVKDDINSLKDLNNKNIYCGGFDSGSCFTANFLEHEYNLHFNYVTLDDKDGIDAYISVIGTPATKYKYKIKGYKFISLPRNKKMDLKYKRGVITHKDYAYIKTHIETYSVLSTIVVRKKDVVKYKKLIDKIKLKTKGILK